VTLQAALGILTLLNQVPIGLGLAHQGMALVVLTIASLHAARAASDLRLPPAPAPDRR
jgi:cytochrome c oxidase assembly protein subunit 15